MFRLIAFLKCNICWNLLNLVKSDIAINCNRFVFTLGAKLIKRIEAKNISKLFVFSRRNDVQIEMIEVCCINLSQGCGLRMTLLSTNNLRDRFKVVIVERCPLPRGLNSFPYEYFCSYRSKSNSSSRCYFTMEDVLKISYWKIFEFHQYLFTKVDYEILFGQVPIKIKVSYRYLRFANMYVKFRLFCV